MSAQMRALLIRHIMVVLAAFVCLAAAPARAAVAQSATTGDVKAAFLYNFARFTAWPAHAFSTATSPFVIGVAGDEGFRRTVDTVLEHKTVGGRTLRTRDVRDTKDLLEVQMLFIGRTSDSHVSDWLKALSGRPVLTVGDGNAFGHQGGMIAFVLEGDRVRFEIRYDATEQAGLKVSSRVLTLARAVHGKN
ncbi:MAG TPA: YfiR family protein [Vicinamibacterales bacterium]|nr:YfiR family protein [Vicinamibacterales bacterium]